MSLPTDRQVTIRIVFSVIGIFIGVSVAIVFAANYHNWNVSVWGLLSGLAAAATLYVHVCYRKKKWETDPYQLKGYMLAGCFVQLLGVCGFAVYLTLALTQKQKLIIEGEGYYLTCVWCFMTWKWGFFLFYFSRIYRRLYCDTYAILPKDEDNTD
ncbi:hypothetical protein ACJMK2_021632 [Sinanodonta woodiana]|uniref:Heme transporter hrg1-A n=1 Tax=Sinanodonta woodiana TaxID=1069815 RepID=A0ABD3THL2_SINWO